MVLRNVARNGTVALIVSLLAGAGIGREQQAPSAAVRQESIDAQMSELGTTLKAAAMSGVISSDEAWEIYSRVAEAAKASYVQEAGDGSEEEEVNVGADPKTSVTRLIAPRPERVQVLLQPEFLRRDLPRLRDGLALDRSQMMIVQTLFEDYTEAFELATAPLREGLAQYRGSNINAFIAFALEDAGVRLDAAVENARRADRDEAMARVRATLSRIDGEKNPGEDEPRPRSDAWKASVIAATGKLDERLVAIRERTASQLGAIARANATITADDLLRMAVQLRSDRAQLRTDVTESIRALTTEAQRGEANMAFSAVMAQIRIGMLLPQGRLGGESMDVRAALTEVSGKLDARDDEEPLRYAEEWLAAWAMEIAARLDARSEATVDREIAGIEYRTVRDRIAAANGASIFEVDRRRLAPAIDPYVAALRRELAASVAARDLLLRLLDESTAALREAYPQSDLASRLRDASLRRGFPIETRPRWAERAVARALVHEDLDDDVLDSLMRLDAEVATTLRTLRSAAIEMRIRRDPELARDFIHAEFEDTANDFDDSVWREVGHADFVAIDGRIESRLRALLTPARFELLPRRPPPDRWDEREKGPVKGKGGTGQGRAKGKAGHGKPDERR